MKRPVVLLIFSLILLQKADAQQTPERKLRIVDTLTATEKAARNPIILKSELDSIIASQPVVIPKMSEEIQDERKVLFEFSTPVIIVGLLVFLAIAVFLVLFLRRQKKHMRTSIAARQELKELLQKMSADDAGTQGEKQLRQKAAFEKKIEELTAELDRLKATNKVALEDYQAIKETIATAYKIRNYPGYEKKKGDGQLVKELINTERSVAVYAFEKFLRPLISIADANKNNPARMSEEDSEKLFDLLLSLSLFYIEYLYLRIDELSVGGHIVERIGSHAKGNGIDHELLKRLNTDHGSRALAIRLALDKKGIGKLSYPVFDETNLNNP